MQASSTSTTLLERLRDHDIDAWRSFVFLYSPLVASWCRRLGVAEADVEDVVQETLAACSRGLTTFRRDEPGDSFRSWLKTIAQNKARDHFRRTGRQPAGVAVGGTDHTLQLHGVADGPESDLDSEGSAPNERAWLIQRGVNLVRAEFTEATWRAFELTATEGVSPIDVAQKLGLSINAVYKARSRVLRRLREELTGLL